MPFEPKSIAEQIECLARLTDAPDNFVFQVRELFLKKGISLSSDASPYINALEEAFQREESIRDSAAKARASVQRLRSNFARMGESYTRQIDQLKQIQSNLQERARTMREVETSTKVKVRGKGKSLVTRRQNDDLPMVPGPKDVQ